VEQTIALQYNTEPEEHFLRRKTSVSQAKTGGKSSPRLECPDHKTETAEAHHTLFLSTKHRLLLLLVAER
jgi:hypothetical protein